MLRGQMLVFCCDHESVCFNCWGSAMGGGGGGVSIPLLCPVTRGLGSVCLIVLLLNDGNEMFFTCIWPVAPICEATKVGPS